MRRLIPLFLTLGVLAGCAALPMPRTSGQAMVAAETAYQAAADAQLAYVTRPDANPAAKAVIQRLNERAYAALLAARAAQDAGRAPDTAAVVERSDAMRTVITNEGN